MAPRIEFWCRFGLPGPGSHALTSHQLSERGGNLFLPAARRDVTISGRAVPFPERQPIALPP